MKKQGDGPGDGKEIVRPVPDREKPTSLGEARHLRNETRRLEAVSLRLAGVPIEQIAQRLEIEQDSVLDLINRTLQRNEPEVEEMRRLENARLDRAQMSIWNNVLEGDLRAFDAYLRLSQRRSRLNGLDAATKIDLGITVRQEMEYALAELEKVVLGEVIHVSDEIERDERSANDA